MKKIKFLPLLLIAIAYCFILTACQEQICSYCGEEKVCQDYDVLGTTRHICEDCIDNPAISTSGNVILDYASEYVDPSLYGVGVSENEPESSQENIIEEDSENNSLNETEGGSTDNLQDDYDLDEVLDISDSGINSNSPETSLLEVHYIDVGQGDCTLIGCDNHWMLIDAGDNSKGTAVQLYLTKLGIENLDYMIVTHRDSDHSGGADVIITKYDIDTFITPSLDSDTQTFSELVDALDYRHMKNTLPVVGSEYSLGNASFTILGPSKMYDDDNNNSVAVRVEFGKNSFLFTGDAAAEAEQAMILTGYTLKSDVLKVGHHGSKTSSSKSFLDYVKPAYAVISCGEDNSYGHPAADTLNKLREMNVGVFRTDEQGTIIATSDGEKITWNASPSDSWKAGEGSGGNDTNASVNSNAGSDDTIPTGANYIGNVNNSKLHLASCYSLPQSQNRIYFSTLEEATAAGYLIDNQCKNCMPYGGATSN